ncbi:superoxide dismutase family protein [Azohydromonas aeria]|uniref:superoxide dismutase family protein n=1 Tax=Azohydromonas aeria TaxID=2590212 RepID=UPI0018E02D53|nr:superoxide dismutase family protein [Azohydromonas aeria]
MNITVWSRFAGLAALAAALAGCAGHRHGGPEGGMHGHGGMANMPSAMATVAPTQGQTVSGMVGFHDMGGHVMVHARLSGLKPNAEHGFHVHEKGDCSAPDATSAGGHFNPDNQPHGPQDGPRHAGDMPNLRADGSGNVDVRVMLRGVSVGTGGMSDVVGRSVVVHAQPDDYRSQPAGNSGARVGCGVIARR